MNVYRISMINRRLNFRKVLDVKATTCLEAIRIARASLQGLGYDFLESAVFHSAA